MFYCGGMVKPTGPDRYHNEDHPEDGIPQYNQGEIPVIVRLVNDEHGVHYLPAEARRWTSTHVMIGIRGAAWRGRDRLAWLRAEDVFRILTPDQVHETAPSSE